MQARLDAGEKPHFLPETRRVRESDWKVRLTGAWVHLTLSSGLIVSHRLA